MDTPQPSRKRRVILTGFSVFLFLVLGFAVFFYVNFHTIEVKGPSMEPTFTQGQRLLVSKAWWLVGDIRKNDIVVFKRDDEFVIKRVYAVGGETVDFYNVPESYNLLSGEYKVPAGEYYVLGDNRPVSEDSRVFGPIDRSEILGKVIVVGVGVPPPASASATATQ